MQEKEKELNNIIENSEIKNKEVKKKQELILKIRNEINLLNEKINNISLKIQKSSGIEQDSLLHEISTLKQEIAGMTARKENFENNLLELNRRKQNLEESAGLLETEIKEISKEKGKDRKKELLDKKARLEELDEAKRQYYLIKSNLSSLNNQIEDKKKYIQQNKAESNFILNQIEQLEREIKIKENLEKQNQSIVSLKNNIEEIKNKILNLEDSILEKEKLIAANNYIIKESEKIKFQVSKLDICPLCKTKITQEHIKEVINKSETDISSSKKLIHELENQINSIKSDLKEIKDKLNNSINEISQRSIDMIKIKTIHDKKEQLKRNNEQLEISGKELENLESKKKSYENKFSIMKISEEQYENLRLEVNELQRSEERNLGIEITSKQRELERIKLAIKQNLRDKDEITENLKELKEGLEEKHKSAEEKEEQSEIVKRKYQKMFEEKNILQDKVRMFESNILKHQNEKMLFESENNNLMILKAQVNAKKESFQQELKEFGDIEFLPMNLEKLNEKLIETENILARIGSVNLRALEVYDSIKI